MESSRYHNKKILVIEEDRQIMMQVKDHLESQGAIVYSTADFNIAYSIVFKKEPHYIVCDYKITNSKAYSFISRLQQRKKLTNDMLIMTLDMKKEIEDIAGGPGKKDKHLSQLDIDKMFLDNYVVKLQIYSPTKQNYIEAELLEIFGDSVYFICSSEAEEIKSCKKIRVYINFKNNVTEKMLTGKVIDVQREIPDGYSAQFKVDEIFKAQLKEVLEMQEIMQSKIMGFIHKAKGDI